LVGKGEVMYYREKDISILIGETLVSVVGAEENSEIVIFTTKSGKKYELYHIQSCCESVWLADVVGKVENIIGSPLLKAEEVSSDDMGPMSEWTESYTWTFYRFLTAKGDLVLRWYGESNGYYSEGVNFIEVGDND